MRVATPRLTLRRFESERQCAAMAEHFADPELSRHLLVSFDSETGLRGNAERFRRNFDETWQRLGFGGVLVHRRGSPLPLGFVALKSDTAKGRAPGCFEVYFGLARRAWGRGYAGEALAAFVAELERRLHPQGVRAAVNAEQSLRAVRVLEKTGFVREGSVALADWASPALAASSLELELWRLARTDATDEIREQAAFRIGQLARAAGRSEAALAERIAAAGGAALRAFSAGTRAASYAVYARRGGSAPVPSS